MRAALGIILLIVVAIVGFSWWTGSTLPGQATRPVDVPVGTSGGIDTSKARERGAEIGERAAQAGEALRQTGETAARAAETVRETVDNAGITSKIKAKMALDEYVRARAVEVKTDGSTVTLTGTVRSNAERDRAVTLARETAGVNQVVDRLVIDHR